MTCSCGKEHGTRKNLDITITPDELKGFRIIRQRIIAAEQALNPQMIPEGTDDKRADQFVRTCLDYKAQAGYLNTKWWADLKAAYDVPDDVWVDDRTGQLYIMEK
jgi:hypothetical protein